jgi:hypothetical protein
MVEFLPHFGIAVPVFKRCVLSGDRHKLKTPGVFLTPFAFSVVEEIKKSAQR